MLAGVIFDFDGVIVDSHPLHLQTWKAFLLSQGKAVSDTELSFVQEGAKREEILRHFLGDITPGQVRVYGDEKDKLFQARVHETKLVGGFVEFLTQLDAIGLPSAVATSGSRRRVEQALDMFNLRTRFRAIVTGEDVVQGKPHPALFLMGAQVLHVDPRRILVCEDAVAGVMAAKTAGMKCVGIAANSKGSLLTEAGADLVVENFAQTSLDDVRRLFGPSPSQIVS
jgi:HAD superfamily hydrolase (TIGR01509 family)